MVIQTKEKLDVILLVLEYAPGGELFDILYYTSALEEDIARTYFRQMIFGLEACHNAGVAHRDIKPQNLLLDSHFNLKVCFVYKFFLNWFRRFFFLVLILVGDNKCFCFECFRLDY